MERRLRAAFENVDLRVLAGILSGGGIIAIPTDTIYGLHCIFSNEGTLRKLIGLKGRDINKGLILLASNVNMVDGLVSFWPGDSRVGLSSIWPAPLTAILPASENLNPFVAPGGKVAVRVPSFKRLVELIDMLGEPIVSTSANKSGAPPTSSMREVEKQFPDLDAYLSRRGRHAKSVSTIVDFTIGEGRVVREGAYDYYNSPK